MTTPVFGSNDRTYVMMFLCNGKKECGKSGGCYVCQGECMHTSDVNYAINEDYKDPAKLKAARQSGKFKRVSSFYNYVDDQYWEKVRRKR